MGEVSESFQGSSMQDAHEFAAQFIDNLKEGVVKMDKTKERVNPVVDNLEMEWEETLVCERCGVQTVRRKREVGLFCSLNEDSSPIDLRELIESSVEPETIERNCEVNNIYQSDFVANICGGDEHVPFHPGAGMQTQPGAAEQATDGNAKGSLSFPQTHGLGCQQG